MLITIAFSIDEYLTKSNLFCHYIVIYKHFLRQTCTVSSTLLKCAYTVLLLHKKATGRKRLVACMMTSVGAGAGVDLLRG